MQGRAEDGAGEVLQDMVMGDGLEARKTKLEKRAEEQ
jgi:hypothetical protein